MLDKFADKWNYGKHAAAVTGVYCCLALIGNALLADKLPEDEKTMHTLIAVKRMNSRQKIFNGVLLGVYAFEMSGFYYIIKLLGKRLRQY
jgi:hypothetical protein